MVKRKILLIGVFILVLATVLFVLASWQPASLMFNPEPPASLKDESLMFLRDVIGFNLTQYRVIDQHFAPQLDVASSNGLPLYLMTYDMEASDDSAYVEIPYTKSNDTFVHEPYFIVHSNTLFSPAYPSDKVLNWTPSFLERYQNFRDNAAYISEIQKTLEKVDHIQRARALSRRRVRKEVESSRESRGCSILEKEEKIKFWSPKPTSFTSILTL